MVSNMDISNARAEVDELFNNLSPLVLEIVNKHSAEADRLIKRVKDANSFTNEELRELILALSIEAYMFGVTRDAGLLKQECATTLLKEQQARVYNCTEGTQVVRQNASLLNSSEKQVVNMLYGAVADMLKTRLDEIHRLANALNSILISRNAEAKLNAGNPTFNDNLSNQLEQERNVY